MSTSENVPLIPMYKARLHELCRQQIWPPPVYTVERDGPCHQPRFSASVTVNGVRFDASALSKSSREAERKAAQVAFDHFAVTLPPQAPAVISPPKPSPQNTEDRIPYKAQLQIYAQKETFELPKYDAVCEGYPHVLRFKASVTVDGQTFNSTQFFSTLKEAENDAAKEALLSLFLDESRQDKSYFCKNMLRELAIKEGIRLPNYKTTSNGASHMPIFSSTVEALLSFPLYESQQDKSYLYKNMLQELAIKEGIYWPKYKTASNTASDMPIFSSTVEIGGSSFMGDVAKSKKQAEINAAKVAWFELKERSSGNSGNTTSLSSSCSVDEHYALFAGSSGNSGNTTSLSSSCSVDEHLEPAFSGSQTKDVKNLELLKSLPVPSTLTQFNQMLAVETKHSRDNSDEKQEDGIIVKNGSSTSAVTPILQDCGGPHLTIETMVNGNGDTNEISASHNKLDAEVPVNKEVAAEATISQDGTLMPSSPSNCSDPPVANVISESPMGRASSSLLSNRVRVYHHSPDMVLPEGAISLPFSDDMFFPVSLDLSNNEDICQEDGLPIENVSSTVSMAPSHQDDQATLPHQDDQATPPPQDDQATHSSKEIMLNGNGHVDGSDDQKLIIKDTLSEGETSTSLKSVRNGNGTVDVNPESPMRGVNCSLQDNRVGVFPNKPDIVLPEGASRLPLSDNK